MFKDLYNSVEVPTQEAQKDLAEIERELYLLMHRAIDKGYKLIDLEAYLTSAMSCEFGTYRILRNMKLRKEGKI